MFKFILHLLATIVASLSLWFIFFSVMAALFFKEDYSVMDFKFNTTPALVKENSILFFGESSMMNAVLPLNLKQEAYNASIQCGGPFDFFTLLNRLDLKKINPRFVVLSMHAKKITNQENCFEDMLLPFNILDTSELKSIYDEKSATSYFNKHSSFELLLNFILYKIYLHPSQLAAVNNFSIFDKKNFPTNAQTNLNLYQDKGYYKCSAPDEFPFENPTDSYSEDFKIHAFDLSFLNKFLQLLNEKNIKVIYLNPAYSQTYKRLLTPRFIASQDYFFRNLAAVYSNFYYINDIIFLENSYFQDSVHLNEKGAAYYTNWTQLKIDRFLNK